MRLMLEPGDDVAALVRGAIGDSRVVVIAATPDVLAMAQARAAIGPLAIEQAPATRVNAVVQTAGAEPADVDAAVVFFEAAQSTTGQVIEIRQR